MRCLGLDLGTKRLGLAISDRLGLISSPFQVIKYTDISDLIQEIVNIISQEQVEKIVLGLPKNMNNSLGSSAQAVLNFKEKLEQEIDIEIILIDERLSTVEAENYLINSDHRRSDRKKIIDAVAASVILDTYLRRIDHERKQ